jgi:hypothetical protein
MSYGNDIKKKARELYLTVDKLGRRKYSVPDITNKIQRKFNKNIHRSTVHHWVKDGNWEDDFIQMKKYGVERARAEEKDDEKLFQKSNDISNLYRIAKGLNVQASNFIFEKLEKEKDDILFRDAVALMKHTAGIVMELQSNISGEIKQGCTIKFVKPKNKDE